jgi:hypothetical protein
MPIFKVLIKDGYSFTNTSGASIRTFEAESPDEAQEAMENEGFRVQSIWQRVRYREHGGYGDIVSDGPVSHEIL